MKQLRRRFYLWLRQVTGKSSEDFAPHGVPVHIPADADLAIRYLLAKGRPYEAPEAEMVTRYLAPGTHVIELGGCMGVVSALIRSRIGPAARHIVVEANPDLAKICGANATRAAAPGATDVVEAAVDYSGAATVTFARGHNAHVGHVARPGEDGFTVPAVTLSQLAARLPEGPFALVCDIEGGEIALFAAEAATGILERITLLVLETHPKVYPGGAADLAAMVARIEAAGLTEVSNSEQVICFRRGAGV